ncbi:ribosome-associated translation inhibitor RaiA [Patescibacteria group bacterium]|nr:ribosome-associated translation inhibitor RaiA [Patescibacteria group bacterium]
MNIDINSLGIDLTEPLKVYIYEKIGGLDKYLQQYNPESLQVDVEVSRTTAHHKHGDVFYAEVNLGLPGKMLRATQTTPDIRVSIDKVKDILQREIRKYKDQR